MNPREKGFLLLTSTLGDPNRRPLTAPQLRELAKRVAANPPARPEKELEEADLLALGYTSVMAHRIKTLLDDEQLLEYYLRAGGKNGCIPVTRVSEGYPLILRKRLGVESPGCLWAKGPISLLEQPAVSLVGSRELLDDNRHFAEEVGRQAACQGYVLVSGNARGADRVAQDACLKAGGSVISVVADELRGHEPHERILYLSEDSFDAAFSAQRAISRNRVIHCLGHWTFVAQSGYQKGGSWDGCEKNLSHGWSPVCCFADGSRAVQTLTDMGAEPVTIGSLVDFARLEAPQKSLFDMI